MPKRKGNFVEEMSQDIKLECRINCNVTDTEQPFPEDDFILADVQVKSEPVKEEPFVLERCTEHGKELIMFCKGEGCKKQICVSCLIGDHRPHDVVEIEKLEVDFLQNKRLIQRNLEIIIRETQTVEEKIEVKTGNFVAEVNAQRDDMNRRFDKMIKDAEDEAATPSTTVSVMQEYLETLKRLNSGDVGNYDMMLNNLENVKGIGNHMKEHLSGNKTYRFYEFIGGQAVKKEISADLSELRWAEAENKESIVTEPSSTGSRTITHASQLNCQGKFFIWGVLVKYFPFAQKCGTAILGNLVSAVQETTASTVQWSPRNSHANARKIMRIIRACELSKPILC